MGPITYPQFPTNSMKTTRLLFPGVMQTSKLVGQKQNWVFASNCAKPPASFVGFKCFCCVVLENIFKRFYF